MDKGTQNALVTGASRGIGEEIAIKLAKEKFRVFVNYSSNKERAEKVVAQIKADGGDALAVGFNVSDSAAVDLAIENLVKDNGPISVLVNNAGITLDSLLLRTKDEDIDRVIDIDLKGTIFCSRAVVRSLIKARIPGSIIQISSVVGQVGNPGQAVYSAAKAGVIGFTLSLAKEIASRNIRVNAIAPGFIATEMTETLTPAQKDAILRNIPLGCFGSVDDIAEAVLYLASSKSKFVTGQVLGINGGMVMGH